MCLYKPHPGKCSRWVETMLKTKELSQKVKEEIISLHQKGNGNKKVSKTLNSPRDIIGSIVLTFKAYDIAANLSGHGIKLKISSGVINDLGKPLCLQKTCRMKAGTNVLVATITRSLIQALHGWTPWCMKGRLEYARRNLDGPAEF